MNRQQIGQQLRAILAIVNEELAQREDISENTAIREGLGLDSLQLAELLFEVEEKFGVKIPDEQAQRLRTVRELVDIIEAKEGKNTRG